MSILKVDNLRKQFKSLEVLKGISFEMEPGEVLAVIGSSGSGKSTLLRCLNFLERADSGSIAVKGTPIVACDAEGRSLYPKDSVLREKALHFGLVFQNYNLFPHLSVLRNLTLAPRSVDKKSKADAEKMAMQNLEKVGLADKCDAYPYQLSGGQCQRVAIARALCMQPDILCFDEPTSALDPELTGEVLKVIRDLKAEGTTMIVVTHEITFARDVADRIMFLDGGIALEIGEAREVFYNPREERTREFMNSILSK